jgi:hypothetical protein
MKLDSYGLRPRNSGMECVAVSESVHSVRSFHRESSLGCSCATSSICRYPYHVPTSCSASLSTDGIAVSCGTCVGSLVCGCGGCSLLEMTRQIDPNERGTEQGRLQYITFRKYLEYGTITYPRYKWTIIL